MLSRFYTDLKRKDSAYYFGQSALQTAKKYNLEKELNDANDALSILWLRFGDYEKHSNTFNMTPFIMQPTTRKVRKTLKGRMQFEHGEKDATAKLEQEKKDAETKRTRDLQYTFIGAFLLLALFFYWNSRQKQKAKNQIENAYSELKAMQSQLIQSEKMASLGELTAGIAHEIQNPLNFVNNFSEVNNELVE